MSKEGAEKFPMGLGVMNILMCCCVAAIGVWQKNALAACGWLCAALAYVGLRDAVKWSYRWESVADKAMEVFRHLFCAPDGKCIGMEIHKVKACGGEDGSGGKPEKELGKPEKELPDFAIDAANSFKECLVEFFHYIEDGNREFAISHGGISISVSIPESAAERRKDADTPQA